ncbi:MAG: F0F1 ATP synthase subunit B [Chloroflexota bacterium]|nr:F0F1 ATP synthase subunit B [Chloroflexota bacterium]
MDKLGLHVPSLIVYLVNFLLLLGILYLFAYKRILNMMDQRSQRIKESLEAADRAREDAARAQEEMKKQMDASRRESAVLLEEARRAADRFREEERARARQEVQAFIEKARADIRRERDVAVDEVRQHFADLAITAAERVISRSLDRRAHKELIEQVLKESEELSKS